MFSNCFSHNSPVKGWPYRFRSRGTTGSSTLVHEFGHLCRGWRIQMSGHSDFGIFNNFWESSIFYLGLSRYRVCCLSIATRRSGQDIHDLGGCHLRCWWSLFSEYCIRPWIVFHNITSEYNSTFVFLVFCLQFSIFQMTCPLMMQNELLCPTSLLHRSPLSCFWLSSAVMLEYSPVFPFFSAAASASGIFNAWGIGMNLCTRLQWVIEFFPFAVMWYWWGLCPAPSSLGLVPSSASTIFKKIVSCVSQYCGGFHHCF